MRGRERERERKRRRERKEKEGEGEREGVVEYIAAVTSHELRKAESYKVCIYIYIGLIFTLNGSVYIHRKMGGYQRKTHKRGKSQEKRQ